MTYKEYIDKKQNEYNSLPIFYAFSNSQLEKELNKRGLTLQDTDKIYKLGNTGGFYLKSDAPIIHAYLKKPDELKELMQDSEFAEDAFYYEMSNHEYHINWQADWDVCTCFGSCEYAEDKDYTDYLKEIGYDENVIKSFSRAKRKFLNDCIKNDWY